tara:strand:- start:29 stop:439 length:411 start_codon:yes stop_codon:yes gene_type:complete
MSTLRTNSLEGVDAKNSITIVAGAGNITTTNVQEGLCKCWVNFDGSASGAASRDSFNVASMTDNGTGTYTVTFSNAMSNTSYTASGLIALENDAGSYNPLAVADRATTSCRVDCENNSSSNSDPVAVDAQIFGDLA